MEVTEVQKITQNVIAEASKVVIAGEAVVEKLLVALLAGGHVLLEDRPGSGKTTLAKTFARLLDVEQKRVQFTPDVLPSDILGFSMYNSATDRMRRKYRRSHTRYHPRKRNVSKAAYKGRAKCRKPNRKCL